MAVIKKLNPEQIEYINWSNERMVGRVINEGQVDELLAMLVGGDAAVVYDKLGGAGEAHALVDKVRKYFGSQRVDLIPLMDEEANELGINGDVGSFVIRKRPIEL